MRRVAVYMNNKRAGVLSEMHPGRDYEFEYDREYLASSLPPVSLTLLKSSEVYKSESLFPFFTNLLPEGSNRQAICRASKIDEEDLFGLLMEMADKDFIGAVEIKSMSNEGN